MKINTIKLLLFFLFTCLGCLEVGGQSLSSGQIDELVNSNMSAAIKEHRAFVSIPNDANYPEDMLKNAFWLKKAFGQRGFEVSILEAGAVPLVFAEKIVDERQATVLFYLHYDGQPVDPSKWDQKNPFIPVLKQQNEEGNWEEIDYTSAEQAFNPEWRVFARAAADDKGPIIMFLQALDILAAQQLEPSYNVKVLLDGEEEKGSAGLKSTLNRYKDQYSADRLIIMDGPAHPTNLPTITFGCRGMASGLLTVYGARVPQHSGHFGNYVPNPVFGMAHLLASMKDEEGRVLIEGFYDGVELDETTRELLAAVPDDAISINTRLGVARPEQVGMSYQESLQYPSLNVKGMAAGWVGQQTRTIVPDKAVVQVGIRLVPETDGDRLLHLVREHIINKGYYVIDREPTDKERMLHPKIASFVGHKSVNAFRTEVESLTGQWLTQAIRHVYARDPVRIRIMGGTVPVTPLIEALNIPAVIVPMVNMDNNQHSPNENLRLGNLFNGIKTCLGIFMEPIILK